MNREAIAAFITKCLMKTFLFLPIKKVIVFESVPDLSDNTKAVFDEMLKRGINKKYKLVWMVRSDVETKKIKNVKYVVPYKLWGLYYTACAKCFISCNEPYETLRRGQNSYYISHGTAIKSVKNYYTLTDKIDYCLSASEKVAFLCEQELGVKKDKVFSLGFPRNDTLTSANFDLKSLFIDCIFEKIIVWYPTYRQHKNTAIKLNGNTLPIIHDAESARKLNEVAKENKVLIVLKPHFAQDLSYVKSESLSNIKFIDDKFFADNNITSYEFVGSCDAMISDYSSIIYDYTLCDKPIAMVWEDYEEYKKWPGIAEGSDEFLTCGEKIYTLPELEKFVVDIANDVDNLKEERNKVCDLVNHSRDGRNSERVVDFIIGKSNL